jgi:L-ascorbate metabolism protein UlaG (beta-lactamase superfamily)
MLSLVFSPVISDHFDGRRFFNPIGPTPKSFGDVPRMMREPRTPWPSHIDVPCRMPPSLGSASAVCTFIGHATFLIQTAAGHLITDPMFSDRAGPFNRLGPRRVRQPAIRLRDLPPISVVLLSHNHYDHCDRDSLRALARRFDPLVLTLKGNARLVRSAGVRRVEEFDWWETTDLGSISFVATRAHHFSARTPFDRNRALWGGFAVSVGGVRIYFAGDTAYAPFFRDVRSHVGPIDLALLPIGAYEPRWFMQAVHMNPAEAVRAHLELEARRSVGMHFGTFQLTTEAIDEPVRALAEAKRAAGVADEAFRVLDFGETLELRT